MNNIENQKASNPARDAGFRSGRGFLEDETKVATQPVHDDHCGD
jgi:hypothetical protein